MWSGALVRYCAIPANEPIVRHSGAGRNPGNVAMKKYFLYSPKEPRASASGNMCSLLRFPLADARGSLSMDTLKSTFIHIERHWIPVCAGMTAIGSNLI